MPRSATPEDVKARYRQLTLKIHPDLEGSVVLFRQVQEAYEVLSDPVRRASYDRSARVEGHRWTQSPPAEQSRDRAAPNAWADTATADAAAGPDRKPGSARRTSFFVGRSPAVALALGGALLLVLGAAVSGVGTAMLVVGAMALLVAGVAGLGSRGAKEHAAFRRSGMSAIDAMSGREFEILLENFFARRGYRVARIGDRSGYGADLLLNDAQGRVVVQARRRNDLVLHDAVQGAAEAMARYRAQRALVVTSSDYSHQAVDVASSHGVILWNRAHLAAELTASRGEPVTSGMQRFASEFRVGSRIGLGALAVLCVAVLALRAETRKAVQRT